MKAVIIYASRHQGNTAKVARAIAEVLNAELLTVDTAHGTVIDEYDLIGLGSGIYWGRHDEELLALVRAWPAHSNRKAFIFSTSGLAEGRIFNRYNRRLRNALTEKGFMIIGEFSCRGYETVWPFKLLGGLNKGRPNESDLAAATQFARGLRVPKAG
ncbi:MAG: flavodoxin family protein [Methanomicrobia archaeon]|nr:flavodoxin family protein [Methanomicrobia archaeon]